MLDLLHLPSRFRSTDVKIFTRLGNDTASLPVAGIPWLKPRGASMVFIICIGGGAGGGAGHTAASGNPRGGGGGGGSGGLATVLIPAAFIPDILYVQVGKGGRGGTGPITTAQEGDRSHVLLSPVTAITPMNVLIQSSNGQAQIGGFGSAVAGGGAGSGATVATIALMPLAGLGIFEFIAGQSGSAGGDETGAAGSSLSFPTTGIRMMGGSGGGGTTSANFAGGGITAISTSFLSGQRPIAAASGSNNGCGGTQLWEPFWSFGGLGGGASNAGIGGNGGNGAYGAGGGGGGGGTTGGLGGVGGSGIVFIISW